MLAKRVRPLLHIKPYQLALLRKNGIPVPKTLVTNDPQEVSRFKEAVGDVVYKPVAGGAECKELLLKDLSKEKLDRLRNAPVMFQEWIKGEYFIEPQKGSDPFCTKEDSRWKVRPFRM